MWATLARAILKGVIAAISWEQVNAILINLILKAIRRKRPEDYAKAKRYTKKTAHQLVVFSAAIENDDVSVEEAREIMGAWARGDATPKELEAKVLGEVDEKEEE